MDDVVGVQTPLLPPPMLTTGVPRYEHSLIPADELPTRQAVPFKQRDELVHRHVGDEAHRVGARGRAFSRKLRSDPAISPVPASGFGQNQIVGIVERRHRAERCLEVAPVVAARSSPDAESPSGTAA